MFRGSRSLIMYIFFWPRLCIFKRTIYKIFGNPQVALDLRTAFIPIPFIISYYMIILLSPPHTGLWCDTLPRRGLCHCLMPDYACSLMFHGNGCELSACFIRMSSLKWDMSQPSKMIKARETMHKSQHYKILRQYLNILRSDTPF